MANELGGGSPSGHGEERMPVTPGRSFAEGITGLFSRWGRSNQMRAQDTRRDDQPIMMTPANGISALPAYTSEQTSLQQPIVIPPSPVGNQSYQPEMPRPVGGGNRRFNSSLIDGPTTVNEDKSTSSESFNSVLRRRERIHIIKFRRECK